MAEFYYLILISWSGDRKYVEKGLAMNNRDIYQEWFVLQVKIGQEKLVDRVLKTEGTINSLVFLREMIHTKRMVKTRVFMPLFPGYVFVQKKLNQSLDYLKNRLPNQIISPIKFKNQPGKVKESEMKNLLCYADDSGRIKLSTIEVKDESIVIKAGPLKTIKGKLLFVNKKKGNSVKSIIKEPGFL